MPKPTLQLADFNGDSLTARASQSGDVNITVTEYNTDEFAPIDTAILLNRKDARILAQYILDNT